MTLNRLHVSSWRLAGLGLACLLGTASLAGCGGGGSNGLGGTEFGTFGLKQGASTVQQFAFVGDDHNVVAFQEANQTTGALDATSATIATGVAAAVSGLAVSNVGTFLFAAENPDANAALDSVTTLNNVNNNPQVVANTASGLVSNTPDCVTVVGNFLYVGLVNGSVQVLAIGANGSLSQPSGVPIGSDLINLSAFAVPRVQNVTVGGTTFVIATINDFTVGNGQGLVDTLKINSDGSLTLAGTGTVGVAIQNAASYVANGQTFIVGEGNGGHLQAFTVSNTGVLTTATSQDLAQTTADLALLPTPNGTDPQTLFVALNATGSNVVPVGIDATGALQTPGTAITVSTGNPTAAAVDPTGTHFFVVADDDTITPVAVSSNGTATVGTSVTTGTSTPASVTTAQFVTQ